MAWEVGRTGDAELDATIGEIATAAAGAQERDGYLNTRFGHRARRALQRPRVGPRAVLLRPPDPGRGRARCAPAATTGWSRSPAASPTTSATTFGPDGIQGVCGHPEIEIALVELYRVTGRGALPRAGAAVRRAPRAPGAGRHRARARVLPGRACRCARRDVFRGHAVRALYLAAARSTSPSRPATRELLDAIERSGSRRSRARTYITGGMGSHHSDESFGEDFELPPDRSLLGDVRRRRVGDAQLAAAARHRRRALRRPRRAHALQRRRDLAGARRARRSSTRTRCTSACPATRRAPTP